MALVFPPVRRFLAALCGLMGASVLAVSAFPANAMGTLPTEGKTALAAHSTVAPPFDTTETKLFTVALAKTAAEREKVAQYWQPERIKRAESYTPAGPGAKVGPTSSPTASTPAPTKPATPSLAEAGTSVGAGMPAKGSAPITPKTVGKVFFKFNNKEYWCSATSVEAKNRSLVATAGHCAYDVRRYEAAQYWIFIPSPESGIEGGIYVGHTLTMHEDFPGKGDYDHDYAFVTVHKGFTWSEQKDAKGAVTYKRTEVGRLQDKVGGLKVLTSRGAGNQTQTFGYPSGPQPDGSRPFNGRTVHVCSGRTTVTKSPTYLLNNGLMIGNCMFSAGASGGPWVVDYNPATGSGFLNGINSLSWNLKVDGRFDAISSSYFGAYTLAAYRHAEKIALP
ncbi:hypothetical protein ACFFOP_13890 [Sinosporangium siamense]